MLGEDFLPLRARFRAGYAPVELSLTAQPAGSTRLVLSFPKHPDRRDYAFCRLLQNLGVDIYVDANSNLTHQGEQLYTGNFGRTLASAPARAIGATKGKGMKVVGIDKLKPNP